MSGIKDQVEQLFEKSGHLFYRHSKKTLLLSFMVVGFFFSLIPSMTLDTSTEALLHKDDPILTGYDAFRNEFGVNNMIVLCLQSDDIFSGVFLTKLKVLHDNLVRDVPYMSKVTSLINARHIRGEEDGVIIEGLLEGWPEKEVDLHRLKQAVMADPVYVDTLISENGRFTTIVLEPQFAEIDRSGAAGLTPDAETTADDGFGDITEIALSEKEKTNRQLNALSRVIKKHSSPDFPIYVAGLPVAMDELDKTLLRDQSLTVSLAFLITSTFLMFLFRRFSGVLISWVIVVSALGSTYGLMALFQVPFKVTTIVLPTFLLTVSVGDAIHILTIFFRQFQKTEDKEASIAFAFKHSGPAVLMTSVTTALGLLSFAIADIVGIAELGVFSAAGCMLALLYSILMIPALLAHLPVKLKKGRDVEKKTERMDRVLLFFGNTAARHSGKIFFISLLLFIGSAVLISQLKFSHAPLNWFPDTMKIKQDVSLIDRELKGSVTMEVVIDTGRENGAHDPGLLKGLEQVSRQLEKEYEGSPLQCRVTSVTDVIKEINRSLNTNRQSHYSIPGKSDLIAQELLLYEMSKPDDLTALVTSDYSKIRLSIKTPWVDAVLFEDFVDDVKARYQKSVGDKADVVVTGMTTLLARTIPATIKSMVTSYIIACICICFVMIIFVGDIKTGLISMIPNLLPIFATMGFMALTNTPVNISTVMIGSIAIGLVVDDTIHFIHNFQRYYLEFNDSYKAVQETLLGTGRALLTTSLILSAGFFISMVASLKQTVQFGVFTGLTVILALLIDFFLTSALMMFIYRKKGQAETDGDGLVKAA